MGSRRRRRPYALLSPSSPMRPTSLLRTSALALLTVATTAAAQGRNLSDPGRMYRAWNTPHVAARGASTYNLSLPPTFGWTDNGNTVGGQLRYASDNLLTNMPVAISGSIMNVHADGNGAVRSQNQLAEQLVGEVDLWSNPSMMFSLTGSFGHQDIVKNWELLPEFDWMLPKNDMFTGGIGAMAYLDRTDIDGINTPTKTRTFAAIAYLNHTTWSFVPEYDFSSQTGVDDSYSIKVTKSFEKMARDPRVFFGLGHDGFGNNSYLAGVRWTMK